LTVFHKNKPKEVKTMLDKNSIREPKVIVELVSKEHDAREKAAIAKHSAERMKQYHEKWRKMLCQNRN
jgi:hypothetical protein